MPNYSKLHDLISHRVVIEYDTGARVSGYLSSCQPSSGQVEFVVLSDAKLIDSRGPHGFTLHFHAQLAGDKADAMLDYLQSIKKIELKPNPFVPKKPDAPTKP